LLYFSKKNDVFEGFEAQMKILPSLYLSKPSKDFNL